MKIKDFTKDTVIYGLGNVLKKGIGLLLIPLYTRYLTTSDYGILDSLSTLTFFLSALAGLGLATATPRYFFMAKNEYEKGKVLYTSLLLLIFSYGIITILGICFSKSIALDLFKDVKYQKVVIVSIMTMFVIAVSKQQEDIFRYYRKARKYLIVILIRAIVNPLFIIYLLVMLKQGVLGVKLGGLFSIIIILIYTWFSFSKNKYTIEFDLQWAKKLLKFGYPLIFFTIAMWIFSASDRFIILHFRNAAEVGLYSIGYKFAYPIILINIAIDMSSGVIMLSSYEDESGDKKEKTKKLNSQIWDIYIGLTVPLALMISIFGKQLLSIFTTPDYVPGAIVIPFIAFSLVLQRCVEITGFGLVLKEKSKIVSYIMVFAAAVNIILNFWLIPKYGYLGAAITTLISYIIYFTLAYYFSQKHFYVKRKIYKNVLLMLSAFIIAWFVNYPEVKNLWSTPIYIKVMIILASIVLSNKDNLLKLQKILQAMKVR
ncbi:MAG: oligosaccharide flippase family protein [Saprospiraceae bacterium]|nr:oligosaccharide flippase family protein [Saprospiraceae bacterium]